MALENITYITKLAKRNKTVKARFYRLLGNGAVCLYIYGLRNMYMKMGTTAADVIEAHLKRENINETLKLKFDWPGAKKEMGIMTVNKKQFSRIKNLHRGQRFLRILVKIFRNEDYLKRILSSLFVTPLPS